VAKAEPRQVERGHQGRHVNAHDGFGTPNVLELAGIGQAPTISNQTGTGTGPSVPPSGWSGVVAFSAERWYTYREVGPMATTISVRLPDDLLARIDRRRLELGRDRSDTIEELIEHGLMLQGAPDATMSMAALLARACGRETGTKLADDDLDHFAEQEVRAHRMSRRRPVTGD